MRRPTPTPSPGRENTFSRMRCYAAHPRTPWDPRTPWEREGESVVALAKTDEPSQISRPSLGKGWGWGLASFEKKYWAHTQ
jgi:hypothetical protein